MSASAYDATGLPPRPATGDATLREQDSIERIAAEHEARGLLNVVVLVERCIESDASKGAGPHQWRRERADALERLERLYARGLPRDFLIAQATGLHPAVHLLK